MATIRFPKTLLSGAIVASLTMAACIETRELSGVYREEFVDGIVPDDRAYVLRITLHEYDNAVGGWVEYYGQDALNSASDPFVLPTYCSYFGEFKRTDVGVVIRVSSPWEDVDLQLRFLRRSRRVMDASVESPGGIYVENVEPSGDLLRFRDEARSVDSGCPTNATLIDRPLTGITPR